MDAGDVALVGAISGLAGAVAGALGAVAAAGISARGIFRQKQFERRYEAYDLLTTAVNDIIANPEILQPGAEEQRASAYRSIVNAVSKVRLSGPELVASAADQVHDRATRLLFAVRPPDSSNEDPMRPLRSARSHFELMARHELSLRE
ncbi:hypothetical protein GCM10010377_68650 [Streptomyces viridiviolaceus]|uniref:Uncharacterized protein n=1 Tax=Streptomyces viridiviolaceus TaxID=68282 RepID=A0ABW2EBH1_9ACTN|nr:hypothetical protein [Streptomyces viridiviolaceus]GHB68003.1 hypothetical protein GCM10010377_68650 [Streptomyces viridiviolaceus]